MKMKCIYKKKDDVNEFTIESDAFNIKVSCSETIKIYDPKNFNAD